MSKYHVPTRSSKCGIEYKSTEMIEWVMSVSRRAHAQLPSIHHTKTLLYVPHERNYSCTSTYIQKSLYNRNRTEWTKGICHYGLGTDTSLPQCLATGIWNLASKATSGPKSQGASLGTTLWHHVQITIALVFVGACVATLQMKFFPYSWRKYLHDLHRVD